jgi:hypothetical protein
MNGFPWGGMVHFELEVVDRDPAVGVNGCVHAVAEGILHRLIRGFDCELSRERLILF